MKALDPLTVGWRTARLWRSQYWKSARIAEHQQRQLVYLLREAVVRVPFYRELGISRDSIHDASALELFPFVTKHDIQQQPDAFIAAGYDREQLHASRTSGSTGEPTVTYFDHDCWLTNKLASKLRRTLGHGMLNARRLMIVTEERIETGHTLTRLPLIGERIGLCKISIHADASEALATLIRYRPTAVYAYPSWFLEVILAAERSNRQLPRIPVLFTSSEVLTDAARDMLQSRFQGRVCDVYGSTEFKEVAWQCDQGRYHINFEHVWVEDAAAPDSTGLPGLALTTLNNRAMPLIRYAVGDRGRVQSGDACPCGRHSPFITDIHGRQTELLQLSDGRRISPYLLSTSIEEHPAIARYQLVQPRAGCLRVNYVPRTPYPRERMSAELAANLRQLLGQDTDLQFRELTDIPRTGSGKHKVLIRAGFQ